VPQNQGGQPHRHDGSGLPRATTWVFAIAAGLSVANIYYAQPLLDLMAQDFDIAPSSIGWVVTLTQIGYALGLIVIVPLGDLIDRRRLVVVQTLLSAGALGLVSTAKTSAVLFIGMVATGVLAVVVQVLVAFAATLARPSERGKTVGTVTSGVVIGILGARFIAGLIADLGGWRAVYLTSAGATLVMAGLLLHTLPRRPPPARQKGYGAALRSIPSLFLCDRVILRRGLLALLIFAAFSTFWTALVLPLSQEPFSYSHTQIGLFGLVGMAGTLAASGAGWLADRGLGQRTTGLSLALLTASWGLIVCLPHSVLFLLTGVILLDLAVQAVHVTNQSIILARHPKASSRLIGGYMVFYSIGSALGAIATTILYAQAGWVGVCGLGAVFSALALFAWGLDRSAMGQSPTLGPQDGHSI
jgi:predicted MFS family arabinose efflux permease